MIELKIELVGIKPPIWRRILVPNDISLDILHSVLQGAMPWQDYHLHEFEIGEDRFEARDERDDSWDPNDGRKDEKKFTLGQLVKKGSQFTYTYDFGDGWRHLVTVEKISKPTGRPDLDFPACVAGERACPPEDCGGPYSYEEFLDALTDKRHPEHRDTMQWAGAFEPEVFSVQQANAAVGAMFVWAKECRGLK
ncbi:MULTISPECIES: plasmid pRiA4b ORF-3 family protein [unclassified Mameliella]|uniref:plasmid pRiA4b ORF-3 family protein n=1 Tax=Mameliella sp. LZ-28 TaxID=2484146 RepID=UPI001FF0C499|nr:plasmid pRiA4b ORF-3 family protein [Mameliella sp. LZ-28]